MNKLSFRLPEGTPPQVRSAISTGILMLLSLVPTMSFYFYLAFSTNAWQMFVAAGAVTVYAIISMAAIWQARRGNYIWAGNVLIYGLLGGLFTFNLVITNFGLTLGVAGTILAIAIGRQLLPPKSARLAIIVTVLGGVFMVVFDLIAPPYRAQMPQLQVYIPIVLGLLVIILLGLVVRQSWGFVSGSLQLKIVIWAGSILSAISLILIIYSTITSRQAAIEAAQQEALAFTGEQANVVRADSEVPLDMARALAQALTAVKDPENTDSNLSRSQVNAMLRQVLVENPNFLGTYTLWEPDAFDGQDSFYRGKEAHDLTGRFIPYWIRNNSDDVNVIPLEGYETAGTGDYYILPRLAKNEVIIAPFIYPIEGVDTVMASFVVPVVYDNEFYGIAGIDMPISYTQDIVDSITLYNETAEAFLITTSGNIISFRNKPELVNQSISTVIPDFFSGTQTRVAAGEVFTEISPDGEYLRVFHPVKLGKTGTVWSFGMIIPLSEITAEATTVAIREAMIGTLLTMIGLVLLWFLIGQVVRPIRALTTAATAISQGNLNTTAEVQTTDETGVLAKAFNLMIIQLREVFATLESRVAERTRNLELAAEVGRTVSQVRSLDIMLTDAAELIRKQFDLYYVQVYLINPSQTYLNLQSGTGHVGKELLGRNHRLPFNADSINGRAAVEKRSVVISDTTANATFKPNPLLPNTRSEMAVPLMIGDRVVGVLDMQSENAGSLNQDTLAAFEALAGQLAIAIQNANFLAETEQARAEVETQARRLSRANWADYLDAIHKPEETGFVFEQNKIAPMTQAEQSQSQTNVNALTSPITVTGEALGNLVVEMEGGSPISRTSELVNTVARQVAQQIESLRLLDSAERYRFEAEEASRRLTREGWKSYVDNANKSMSYVYDLKEVRLQNNSGDQQVENTGYSLPLKVRDETIGKLIIQGLEASDAESVSLANAVAERLGAHIESLRQFEETQRGQIELDKRARQLAAVADVSSVSSRELDIQKMLESVVHLTQRKFDLYHAHVFTYNQDLERLQIVACGYKEGDEHEGTHGTATIALNQEQSLVARTARTREPVIVNDVRNEPGWLPNPLLPDTASELAVPLVIGNTILGVLDVQSDKINAFTQEDANIYSTLASQIATSLQNAHSFAQAQQQADRESRLNVISQKIQSATTVEAVLQIAARELGHTLGAPLTIAQLGLKETASEN